MLPLHGILHELQDPEQIEALEEYQCQYISPFLELLVKHDLPNHHRCYISLSEAFWLYRLAVDLNPSMIIESGTFHGYSAWWLHKALNRPEQMLVTCDPQLPKLKFGTNQWQHFCSDFREFRSGDPDFPYADSLAFFDDHVDQSQRLQQALKLRIPHMLFHDVYPSTSGAHESLWRCGIREGMIEVHQFPRIREPEIFRRPEHSCHSWLTYVRVL